MLVLDVEVFVVVVFVMNVGIVEFEVFVEFFVSEVQFGVIEIDQVFWVDDDFYVMVFEDQVFGCQFIDEFEDIGKFGIVSGVYVKMDIFVFVVFFEGVLYVFGGGFGYVDGYCNFLFVMSGLE